MASSILARAGRRIGPAAPAVSARSRRLLVRIPLAVAIGVGLVIVYWSLTSIGFEDVDAYWSAAIRVREGAPLFPAALDTPDSMLFGAAYRYAPWFAWVWVPLTYLPRELVTAAWAGSLLAATAYVAWSLRGSWIAFALLVPILFDAGTDGNVQPLLVAGLVYALPRRSGPAAIAVAASLKAVPLALALVYLGRRDWRSFAWSLSLTALLVAPMLLVDLTHYPDSAGGRVLLYGTWLYPLAILASGTLTLRLARYRWGWLAAGATAVLAMPRFWTYDLTWLVPGSRLRDADPVGGDPLVRSNDGGVGVNADAQSVGLRHAGS